MTISVENGSFCYKGQSNVLNDINFSASNGDLVAVLGPNGAGKTTLLRCLMGFLKWQSGKSLIDGENIADMSYKTLWKKLSYVPQSKNVSGAYTVLENVLLGFCGKIGIFDKPSKSDVEKALSVLARLHIEKLADKKCSELSGGELQMALIARAIASEPQILILDEPESNLDFRNQLIVLDIMSELSKNGMTCIFNTHFPAHALQRANKSLLLMENGSYLFGNTSQVVTEENIERAFNVKAKIGEIDTPDAVLKSVVPICVSENAGHLSASTDDAKRRIAVVSVITADFSNAEKINDIVHKYNSYLIGRMGLPYRECNVNVINFTFDAPQNVIENFADELSKLNDISIKTTFSRGELSPKGQNE